MMKPLRLNRAICIGLLALCGLLAFSYYPLSRIRAASSGATILPSAGKPLVNFKNPQNLKFTYGGDADAVSALQGGTANPTALAAADFNADGAMDVVAGYSNKTGGLLVLFSGNPDAYAPTDLTLYGKAAKGSVPPTFLSKASVFSIPESPDLLVTGDFNHDGYKDVLVASRGGSLYLLAGDGHGNLLPPQIVPLTGQVMAMAVAGDSHVAVSMASPSGSQLVILAASPQGLIAGASYPLPAEGDSVAWGNLGGGADIAVGAGANVVMIYNALTTSAQTETVPLPFQVMGLATGDFIWDQNARQEIAVLADDGSVQILQHGTLNTAPLTAAQLPGRRAAMIAQSKLPSNPTALGAWTVAKQLPYTGSAPAGAVSPSAFNSPRVASSSTQDLMVLDAGRSQLNILDTSGKTESPSAGVSFTGTPVAALALPGKIDSGRDIIVLAAGQAAPISLNVQPEVTLTVDTTADIDTTGVCTSSSTTIPSPLSLRAAVCIANNSAPATSTVNLTAGTYDLTSLETGELQVDPAGAAYSLTIISSGTSSNTLIQQTDGHDRVLEIDVFALGNMNVTIQNVTLQGGDCSTGTDCTYGGGAILDGGNPTLPDNLTLTNVVENNNTAGYSSLGENGGAMDLTASGTYIFTNSTFSNNTAFYHGGTQDGGGAGGAAYIEENAGGGNLTVTNCSFTNNTSQNGGGAALYLTFDANTNTATISGSTFTGNSALDDGGDNGAFGAIVANGDVTISNSLISGNTDADAGHGTGLYTGDTSAFSVVAINNFWGCNGGPGASGCDTAVNGGGGDTLTTSPYLVLSVSANPSQILPSGTSTLTADLTHNSMGAGGFSVPNGTAVTFGGTLDSSINPTSSTLTSGLATSTYTAGSSAGNGTGTATVDNATASATINILDSVTVTTNPTNLLVIVDGTTYTTPTFNWVVGSMHTLNTNSPQAGPTGSQYVWSNWSQGGTQSQSVTAPTATTTYTANFTTQYQLTMVASPSADGSVTPTSGNYYAGGAIIPVTATANAGFAFSSWSSTGGGTFGSTSNASTTFTMPGNAATVTGNFVAANVSITITTSPVNLLVSVDGGPSTAAPLVESWTPGSSHTIATTSPQSGGTGVQYVWSNWSDLGAISHSITVPGSATTYTANFSAQYQLTTAANPSAGGTVSPTSGNYYTSGTVVPLTATANAGYSFVNWTGNVANSTSATTSITMTAPQSVTANFSLIIVAAPTTTVVTSNNNPSFTTDPGLSVTFTAAVSSSGTVNEGTVTFTDSLSILTCNGGNTVAVSGGQAQCVTSFTTEGTDVITGTYNGTVNFQGSFGTVSQMVNNHTVITGNQFCNQGTITVPSTAGAATPYPSNIFVTGLSGNIGAVTVQLNNISSSDIAQTDLLLVGPTGAAIVPFAAVGDGSTISGVDITLDDTASSLIPGGSPLITGTYKPTSITGSNTLVFPTPAPTITAANYAATDGAATLTSEFGGTAPNGTWALYAIDNAGNGAATIGSGNQGWCLNITPPAVSTTITTSPANLLVSVDGGTATAAPLVENWIPGSTHTIATTSPQTGSPGVQYVWSNWSDLGAISHSITVPSSATTYTANFSSQYQLTMVASPPADGTVTPSSGSYYAGGAIIPVTATANGGFAFTNWTSTGGSFGSTTSASTNFTMPAAPATVTGNFGSASVQITITTTPASLLVSVDGGTATAAPLVETWVIASSHTIATTSPQSGGAGVQYVWSSWSDFGAISHSITVPSSATTYTATFSSQYQLTTQASPSADGTVTPSSGSYYAGGAIIPVTATANSGFTFSNWTSTGGSFGSTTSPSTNFTMPSAPATVTGNFTTASVQITITTSPAHLLVSVDGGTFTPAPLVESWIIGSSHTIATTSPQAGGIGVQYAWSSWSDFGAISHSITVPSSATTYTASFNTQYQLTTAANPSNGGTVSPTSGTFYNANTVVPLTATANAGYTFSNWTGNVANANSASTTITMIAPESVTANFTAPSVTLTPTSINFGTDYLYSLKDQNVTVKNTGSSSVTINSVSVTLGSGTHAGDFTFVNLCPRTLAAGKSCIVSVVFFAGNIGSLSATLNVNDNASGSPQTVSLSANVINPQASYNPRSLNFGTVEIGHSSTKTVTVTSSGTTALDITSVNTTGPNHGDYVPSNACPSSLSPGATCTISVTFTPSTTGTRSANLTVVDNAIISTQNVALTGKGSH